MASKQAAKRLQKEYQAIQKGPPPFVWASPSESNILEWHYILRGPPDSPYHGGEYYGTIIFPPEYPFAPPGIKMNTPSGRFSPSAAICTSMSNFHPGSWNPAWSVQTILTGLLSFMLSDEITTGSIRSSVSDRQKLAAASHAWNIAHPKFRSMFPQYAQPTMKDLPDMGVPKGETSSGSTTGGSSSNGLGPNVSLNSPLFTLNIPDGHHHHHPSTEQALNTEVGAARGQTEGGILHRWRRHLGWAAFILALSWAIMKMSEE